MSEFEIFAREWESAERSRHAELIKDLKREFLVEPKSVAVGGAIESSYSLPLPPVAPRQQSYRRYPERTVNRSRHNVEE